jgi:branched-chain amino acid transport system ATP-binding protein
MKLANRPFTNQGPVRSGDPIGVRGTDVRIRYGPIEAVHGISVDIRAGGLTAIVGPNGAGKSTLLKGIMGLLPKAGGTIELTAADGKAVAAITKLAAYRVARQGVSLVPEGREVLARMTVWENLDIGGYQLPARERRVRTDELFERFPRLAERRDQYAGTLSGGEQQMLAIARALVARPRLLLLDEPSLGLAPVIVRTVTDLISEIKQQGTTIALVEQNTKLALELADYVYVISGGSVALSGTPEKLGSGEELRRVYLQSERERGKAAR